MSSNLKKCRSCHNGLGVVGLQVGDGSRPWIRMWRHDMAMDRHHPPLEAFTEAFLSLHQNGGLSRHPFCPCAVSYAQLHPHESSCTISWFLSAFPTQARDDAHRTGTTEWVGDRIPLASANRRVGLRHRPWSAPLLMYGHGGRLQSG
jgi:hypothetical protein